MLVYTVNLTYSVNLYGKIYIQFWWSLSILWFVDPTTLINKNFYCHFYSKGVWQKGGIYIGLSFFFFLIPKTGLYDTHDIDLFSYYLKMISNPHVQFLWLRFNIHMSEWILHIHRITGYKNWTPSIRSLIPYRRLSKVISSFV